MRWARVAAVVAIAARPTASAKNAASLLTATMLVTDVGTVADRVAMGFGSGAHDAITTVVGTTITVNGAVIEIKDFAAKTEYTPPSSPNSSPVDTF